MGDALMPCPFCGETPRGVNEIIAGKVWAIDCKNLLHSAGAMSWVSADDVIAQWNRRDTAQHKRIVAGLEARLREVARQFYEEGWDEAARWAERDDLFCDKHSRAYTKARDAAIDAFLAQKEEESP